MFLGFRTKDGFDTHIGEDVAGKVVIYIWDQPTLRSIRVTALGPGDSYDMVRLCGLDWPDAPTALPCAVTSCTGAFLS